MDGLKDIELTSDDLRRLLDLFSICHYKTKDSDKRSDFIETICVKLFAKDYDDLEIINNDNGELASSYPSKIIIPHIYDMNNANSDNWDEVDSHVSPIKRCNTLTNDTNGHTIAMPSSNGTNGTSHANRRLDVNKLKDLISRARVARCRARFPIPVILCNNKYICRSATLSGGPEIYGRSGLDFLFSDYRNNSDVDSDVTHNLKTHLSDVETTSTSNAGLSLNISDSSHLFSKVRNRDIELLKYLSVGYICDLMVEKKKVKFGMNVTSSEKADKESRYQEFTIMSLPYPGCEFFKDYRDNGYSAEGLIYDWKQHFVDANLIVPNNDGICEGLNIDWNQYRNWDVIKLTQNYLKLLLLYFNLSDSSILIHCISGWDRTPLFTSLLRLSLWADGKIHQNLSPIEMTFLTISYDWFLFGHNLNDRLNKGEEILFFCFYFLKYIISEEFSIDFLTNNCCKERKHSVDHLVNTDVSQILLDGHNNCGNYRGSSTSLNSNCSSTSTRSQDNCPPLYFPICNTEDAFLIKSDRDNGYGKTPPTLTNSEEGYAMFATPVNSIINKLDESMLKKSTSSTNSTVTSSGYNTNITQPVAIPANASHKSHKIDNDLSSLSRSDSWQLVSDTGSIRETSLRYSSPDSLSSPKTNGNSIDTSSSSNSDNCDFKNSFLNNNKKDRINSNNGKDLSKTTQRRERLQAVRSIFYNSYSSAIGFKFKNGLNDNSARFSTLLDQFAGLYSTRVTAPH
ncbi:myotubularin-related protein 14-like [Oppia nitens]|uniref:myotubularin-related protein 14-like n=1 Tax=Oppia nitens TaxID=1686743 RepID=UPI0023DB919F|nr:myotubularin-related protein 14-like [Oppia nitens]